MAHVIAVDLDGTLAHYDKWRGIHHIGAPIPAMLELVKGIIGMGTKVVIFTARANDEESIPFIEEWLKEAGLPKLEITNIKRKEFTEIWDDRAVSVKRNAGVCMNANAINLKGTKSDLFKINKKGFSAIQFTQLAIWNPHGSSMKIANGILPSTTMLIDDLLMDGTIVNPVKDFPLRLDYVFNAIPGMEIEYIYPESDSDHWLDEKIKYGKPCISHLGAYCEFKTMNECIEEAYSSRIKIIQKTKSHSHTNERSNGIPREYFDVVFDTERLIGFNIKLTTKANGYELGDLK
jgi:hypothetical protein